MTTYYKFLQSDHKAQYSEYDYSDYLPSAKPGKWLPKVENLVMCQSGYHVCIKKDLLDWTSDILYIVEIRGKRIKDSDKIAAQEMRFVTRVKGWNDKNLRLAAAEIVEKISMPIWHKYRPDDKMLEDVIGTVKRYARGQATDADLSAAESAAWSVARSVARSAASSVAWSAAESAASSAARSAARSAAWSAAESAARRIIFKRCGL